MTDEPFDPITAQRESNPLDGLTVELAQTLHVLDELGLEYAALKIAEAIDIIETSHP
ncbi:hypothetical protein [Croceicoccus sediminis]|uniref:hypothetical protein n=1 Tax=Croceicoccus sediminis TaxID=2571150 RepID=UPI001478846E|nr:hypothetical protein [Croceicoccus sediminis]